MEKMSDEYFRSIPQYIREETAEEKSQREKREQDLLRRYQEDVRRRLSRHVVGK